MDFNNNMMNPYRRKSFNAVEGTIVDIEPTRIGNRRANGCMIFVSVEDADGNMVNFIMTPNTYIVDFVTLHVGMKASFFYRADAPMPLIYPPQYNGSVIAPQVSGQMIAVGYFNNSLVNEEQTLQLNMDKSVAIMTTNNQIFMGSPANHNLVVVYETTTRSIPAQTTPVKIIVLCD